MGLTERHKKPGGFRKIVNSLETTMPDKRKKILDAMRAEDPSFVDDVEAALFTFDDFLNVNDLIICEIVGALSKEMRTVALALFHHESEALVKKFCAQMRPPEQRDFRDVNEGLKNVLGSERMGAQFRIIEKAREMESRRKFTLRKYSEKYRDE